MATEIPIAGSSALIRPLDRVRALQWTRAAWGSIAAVALYLGITFWWLTQDRSIPIFDAGLHLALTLDVHKELAAGHLGNALTLSHPYPPFSYLVGVLGIAIGGVGVAPPIIAQNLVFVTLLALGCYHTGRLAFGPTAGFLAVVFALGSPLIASMFHVIMVDGPETAMVAASLWAILASERFARTGISALAGLCVGLGMLTKEPFVFFVAGPLLVIFVRGGWRNWRGLLAFAVVAIAIALPWYISQISELTIVGNASVQVQSKDGLGADIAPQRASLDNLEWYAWNFINAQLYLPLFLFAAVGWAWTIFGLLRRRLVSSLAPELLVGAFVGWLGITETFAHDTRYSMPLLVYIAVFGAGWITRLPHRGRMIAGACLVLVAAANTAGVDFAAGKEVQFQLPGANRTFRQNPGVVTVFSDAGFLAGAPKRDGNLLAVLRALKRNGVGLIELEELTLFEVDFSEAGISALSQIAGVRPEIWSGAEAGESPVGMTESDAFILHGPVKADDQPPCLRVSDGTGVWIIRGNPDAKDARFYCPLRNPQYYHE